MRKLNNFPILKGAVYLIITLTVFIIAMYFVSLFKKVALVTLLSQQRIVFIMILGAAMSALLGYRSAKKPEE